MELQVVFDPVYIYFDFHHSDQFRFFLFNVYSNKKSLFSILSEKLYRHLQRCKIVSF